MSKISVLMPVYNTNEEYLKESIQSILNQTYSDFELIIVDDGSEKNIEKTVQSFNDSRIKLYKNEKNIGVSATRNKLINLANSEYIAFQDSDDISYPLRLEKELVFLENNLDISGVGSWLEIYPHKKFMPLPSYPKMVDFLGGCLFCQPACMLRVKDFKKNNLWYNEDLKTSEDYDLWSRAVRILKFANLQEPLIKYRRTQDSLYHKSNKLAVNIDTAIKHSLSEYLICDDKLQKNIIEAVSTHYLKKDSIWEKIFSVKNEWYGFEKHKVLIIFGIKIKLYKHKIKQI